MTYRLQPTRYGRRLTRYVRLLAGSGRRLTRYEQLALQVLDIIAGCGLIQQGYSISGGINYYYPHVVEIVDGSSPKGLIIEILPGQIPADFAAQATRIAYHLDIAGVQVVELEPPRIRLELLPYPFPHGGWSILLRERNRST